MILNSGTLSNRLFVLVATALRCPHRAPSPNVREPLTDNSRGEKTNEPEVRTCPINTKGDTVFDQGAYSLLEARNTVLDGPFALLNLPASYSRSVFLTVPTISVTTEEVKGVGSEPAAVLLCCCSYSEWEESRSSILRILKFFIGVFD
ncbi:hypothetical protein M0804_001451 [Polistes exclamans]|nr:hypothetical protein M0804_001451 [Polistes exclamans]